VRTVTALSLAGLALAAVLGAGWIHSRFQADLASASARAAQGSKVLSTRCGPIEVQEAGQGPSLLMVHGSGGGHDQGMHFARGLVVQGLRVIAVSRFGYLRTPMPADASSQAQADAHVCVLDALGIAKAAIMGVSAGAPSALQAAIAHPERVSALVLVVPIASKPGDVANSAPAASDEKDDWLLRLLGSDYLYWVALNTARAQVFRHVLATPPERIAAANTEEKARVNAMAENVLPVSLRAAGLRSDTRLGKSLKPFALNAVRAPTLVISARDDGFGTFAAAQYTASQIAGARFVGFEHGGHLLVGHNDAMQTTIALFLKAAVTQ
jgi:2-hydroxy-6-oxonona-2,4-dienedioate hydrolase